MIALYMEYCRSKQLRPKTMLSYEQTIKLFARWLKEVEGIDQVEQIKEATIRHYILELQSRGKYTFYEAFVFMQHLEPVLNVCSGVFEARSGFKSRLID